MSEEREVRNIDETVEPKGSPGISAGVVVAVIVLVLFVVFIVQNLDASSITYLGFDVELPQWLLSLIVFLLGAIVGYLAKTRRVRRKRKEAISP